MPNCALRTEGGGSLLLDHVGVGAVRSFTALPCDLRFTALVRKVKRSRVCELSKGNVDCSRVFA